MKRLIQKKILDGLSIAMLDGRVTPGMQVNVDVENRKIKLNVENPEIIDVDL